MTLRNNNSIDYLSFLYLLSYISPSSNQFGDKKHFYVDCKPYRSGHLRMKKGNKCMKVYIFLNTNVYYWKWPVIAILAQWLIFVSSSVVLERFLWSVNHKTWIGPIKFSVERNFLSSLRSMEVLITVSITVIHFTVISMVTVTIIVNVLFLFLPLPLKKL